MIGEAMSIAAQRQALSNAEARGRRASAAQVGDLRQRLANAEASLDAFVKSDKNYRERLRQITLRLGMFAASEDDGQYMAGLGYEFERLAMNGMTRKLFDRYGKAHLDTFDGQRTYALYMAAQAVVIEDVRFGYRLCAITQSHMLERQAAGEKLPPWMLEFMADAVKYFNEYDEDSVTRAAKTVSAIVAKLKTCDFVSGQLLPTFESMAAKFPWTMSHQVATVRKELGIHSTFKPGEKLAYPLHQMENWELFKERGYFTVPR